MFENLMSDKLIGALKPQIEKAIEPLFLETRAALLSKIAGPAPGVFAAKVNALFSFSVEEVQYLWEAACESVL